MSEQKENSMSAAARLRELHERGHYDRDLDFHINLQRNDSARTEAWSLLPEIASVIEAVEAVDREHAVGLPAAIGSAENLHAALAALSARLGGE